jgi:hypothetical protein
MEDTALRTAAPDIQDHTRDPRMPIGSTSTLSHTSLLQCSRGRGKVILQCRLAVDV